MIHAEQYKLIIFDADGTLRSCKVEGQPCPNKPGEWELLPGVRQLLSALDRNGVGIGIASNQGGVGLGYLSYATAHGMLLHTYNQAVGRWPKPGMVRMCHHNPDEGCDCRKPMPGMLMRLMELFQVDQEHTLFVGDRDVDEFAAVNANIDFMYAWEFFMWEDPNG